MGTLWEVDSNAVLLRATIFGSVLASLTFNFMLFPSETSDSGAVEVVHICLYFGNDMLAAISISTANFLRIGFAP